MGNAVKCLAGGPVVKVMLPDATIETYDHAIQVAELVATYPNYAVVHCSTSKPSLGQFRAVIIMKMDELLVPGQAYILYPIPKSFNDSFHVSAASDSAPKPDPSSVPEAASEMKTKTGSGQLEGPVTTEELQNSLSRTLMGPAIGRKAPAECLRLLDLENEELEQTESKKDKEVEADTAAVEPCAWTPDLYKISED